MSYVVLARKYRPKTFAEMVGQEHVVQALGNALRTRRLHHAYLFTGTRGVGKTTVSRILAKSLNCTGPDGQGDITDAPCGVCDACRAIDAGRFVDYTELDAASNRGVDEVQTLLEQAVYKPVQGRFKVFMIDEVHMLTSTAFNAMLKTLEEPPEYLKFVLATTDPQKVPVTVLSRCLQFNLRPMAPETVAEHLQRVLATEGVTAEAGAVRLLARAARGSMRDALSLTDQAIAFCGGALQEAGVRQMLGAVEDGYVLALLQALARRDATEVVQTVQTMRQNGVAPDATLEELVLLLQRVAVRQWTGAAADTDDAQLDTLAQALPPDVTQLLYSLCLHGRGELGLAPDEYAALTMILLRALTFLASAPAVVPSAPLDSVPPAAPTMAPDRCVPTPVAVPAPPVSPPSAVVDAPVAPPAASAFADVVRVSADGEGASRSVDEAVPGAASATVGATAPADGPRGELPWREGDGTLGDWWARVVDELEASGRVQALARELALQSECVACAGSGARLRVPQAVLAQDTPRERLRRALIEQLGLAADWRLEVEVGPAPDAPALRRAAAQRARLQAAEATLRADPFVQAMMRDYGAIIVPGSIEAVDGPAPSP
ncbi:DNA polymerase III subunit gamma/tau [Tepidimonas sp.]|uniref:DNA polymerase III subunit gamma/tau n=1 Tax=Tepidimonas sp. TaxID=2002775 RepID=UPI002FE0CF0A